jgi:hypothetical protein
MKYAMLAVLILPLAILGLTAIAAMLPMAVASVGTPGPHGLSEILYGYTSAAGNNGSAFGGLSANTPWYNTTLGIAMLLGRFAYAIPVLAIAGSIAAKPRSVATTSYHDATLCRPARRNHPDHGRPAILSGARAGADCRAFRNARRPDLLRHLHVKDPCTSP